MTIVAAYTACIFERGGERTLHKGLYLKVAPLRGTFFRLQVYERVVISLVEVYERVGNLSFQSVKRLKRANRCIL